MEWSAKFNCHIVTVIHSNYGSEKPTGHLGSFLEKKTETQIQLELNSVHKDNPAGGPLTPTRPTLHARNGSPLGWSRTRNHCKDAPQTESSKDSMRGWGGEEMKTTGSALNSNKQREMKWLDLEKQQMEKQVNQQKSCN